MRLFLNTSAVSESKAVIKLIFQNSGKRTNHTMANWQQEKEKLLSMDINEKRTYYKSKNYFGLNDVPTWKQYALEKELAPPIPILTGNNIDKSKNGILADKISIFKGDICTLEVDCIVNAANKTLLGGGGVDYAIHKAAGKSLVAECRTLHGCQVGEAKLTGGYMLPAKYVIHTVGPQGEISDKLAKCYKNSMDIFASKNLRSIAFPCISTGVYGYPLVPAAHVAIYEVRKHLEKHIDAVDRVIFCLFAEEDVLTYQGVLQSYFPVN